MITLKTHNTGLTVSSLGPLVVGNINSISIGLEFSSEWAGLTKIAVFSNGSTKVSVALSENSCVIPWEVLTAVGEVFVSLRGVGSGGSLVICTEEVSLGKVSQSSASSNAALAGTATAGVIDGLIADVEELKSGEIFLTSHQSLAAYRTAAAQDAIDSGKLSVAQGAANAGKFLVVGGDGNIAAVSLNVWQGGSF